MVFSHEAIDRAIDRAYQALSKGSSISGIEALKRSGKISMKAKPFVKAANNIHAPAFLQQELAFTTANRVLRFSFGSDAPAATSVFDNITLGKNDVFATVGLRLSIGVGANAANRVYNSYGASADVESLYNSQLSMSFESRTPVNQMHTSIFKEKVQNGTDTLGMNGLVLIRPLRIFTGDIAKQVVEITFPDISALTIPANTFIRCSLFGALARA